MSAVDIYEIIKRAINARPLWIDLWDSPKDETKVTASVIFAKHDDVKQCIATLNRVKFEGSKLRVEETRKSNRDDEDDVDKSYTSFIMANLDRSVTEQQIRDHLQEHFGIDKSPKSITLRPHLCDRSRPSFAFIVMES